MLRRTLVGGTVALAIACGIVGALMVGGASGGGGQFVTVLRGDLQTMTIDGTSGHNEPDIYRDGNKVSVSPAYNDTFGTCSENGSTISCPLTGANGIKTVGATLADGDDSAKVIGDLSKLRIRINGEEGIDSLVGGRGKETLKGGPGPDNLKGRGGNDVLNGGPDNDELNGGSGTDTCRVGGGLNATKRCERPRSAQ